MCLFVLLPCLGAVAQSAGKGQGGDLYLEDHARVIGTVVYGNRAEDGFGIYGGDVDVINCTVAGNEVADRMLNGIRPGYIYCADGSIIDRDTYRANPGGKEVVGVVFWINSDLYTPLKGYVVALNQEMKVWGDGPSQTEDFEYAVFDTAAYENTRLWATVSEAARYCKEYTAGTFAGSWVLPAGYQLAALFAALPEVEATLQLLEAQGMAVSHFTEDFYWSSSETSDIGNMWVLNFGKEGDGSVGDIIGAFSPQAGTDPAMVRPVFAY